MKFVNAAKHYNADVIILGGDITGKIMVPIIKREEGTYIAEYKGQLQELSGESQLSDLLKNIRYSGQYPFMTTRSEYEELANDKSKMDAVFSKVMAENVERWVKIAEERLRGSKTKCLISPGNDDRYEIDPILSSSDVVINPEGRVVMIDDRHEMITLGYTNVTPWNAPRDIDDEELGKKIEDLASKINNVKDSIFNLHCPPYDSSLDTAPLLRADLRPVVSGGAIVNVPVGSKTVRRSIETHQPLLGLHGHIHEAKGVSKIGRTLCVNPGSEYAEGILSGAVVDLDEKGIKGYVLTSG